MVALLTTALVGCSLAYSVYDTRTNPAAAYFVTTTRMWDSASAACWPWSPTPTAGGSDARAGLAGPGWPR